MLGRKNLWRNRHLREHVAIIDGKIKPSIVLKNGIYLNVFTNQWIKANIWIYKNRIIYVGDRLPTQTLGIDMVDCNGKYLVPGYIEPHAHPFQLYNPEQLAYHAAKTGTTTLVNDSIMWFFLTNQKTTLSIVGEMEKYPISLYWWARFDSQTVLKDEQKYFDTSDVLSWITHPSVVQGGELSSWPRLLAGDDRILYWIQEAKRIGKPIEGHFPGASIETLMKMKLLGVSADHESMTGEDVINRLQLGYHVGLRYSSIRPDLPKLIQQILDKGIKNFDQISFTTDGSTPSFYKNGMINVCIEIAIENGIPIEEAYKIASYNVARHLHLSDDLGSIAPGKLAHINVLTSKENPHPESVLAKGEWIIKNKKEVITPYLINWQKHGIEPLQIDWDLNDEDLNFSLPFGLKLINDVIVKPYIVSLDDTYSEIPNQNKDAFLLFIDKHGKWRVNTMINGFTNSLGGFVSSYSPTGDIVMIGKNKQDMILAWRRMKEIGGGIVLVHEGNILFELPLLLGGMMYDGEMIDLMEKEEELKDILINYGYQFTDPIFTVYFLSSTNLPYIRVTQKGIYDVIKQKTLFPANMR